MSWLDRIPLKRCWRCLQKLELLEKCISMAKEIQASSLLLEERKKEIFQLELNLSEKLGKVKDDQIALENIRENIEAERQELESEKKSFFDQKTKQDVFLENENRRMSSIREHLAESEFNLKQERENFTERERIIAQRELNIDEGKKFIIEKEALLTKRESLLWSEKEKMVGQDNLETKRNIILPSLQQKWDAEKKKIDAERIVILESTPKVWNSLDSKKIELEKIIETIKSKPQNSSNHSLLVKNEGKLEMLLDVISMIDKQKEVIHAA